MMVYRKNLQISSYLIQTMGLHSRKRPLCPTAKSFYQGMQIMLYAVSSTLTWL